MSELACVLLRSILAYWLISGLRKLTQEKIDLFVVRVKRVRHRQVILALQSNGIPIYNVRQIPLLKLRDGSGPAFRPSVLWRNPHRFLPANGRIELADGLGRF